MQWTQSTVQQYHWFKATLTNTRLDHYNSEENRHQHYLSQWTYYASSSGRPLSSRGVHGGNPRVSRGCEYERCGIPAGMDFIAAGTLHWTIYVI